MAGPSTDFQPSVFRDNIRAAMAMGLPNQVAMRPTFHFPEVKTFPVVDPAGRPYDWTDPPTTDIAPRPDVQPPCAIDLTGSGTEYTPGGALNPGEAVLVLLDEDWETVQGFESVSIQGDRYLYVEHTIFGLFDVDVISMKLRTENRS